MNQIRSTGHPFVDVGFATMTAFVGKQRVADLDAADFQRIADYIEANYVRQPLRSFLTVAFTSNAWFAQSAFNPDRPG
ncbi:MAG: type I-B CRISPR-associated protein Cas8b1/Cst1, partial [Chloroflexus sp.]